MIKINHKIIKYEYLLKYHKQEMVAGVALAYKIFEAISSLFKDFEFSPFYIYNGVGNNGKGLIDSFRFVFGENVDIDCSYDHICPNDCVKAPNGGYYYFEFADTKRILMVKLLPNILPIEFYELSRAAKKNNFNDYKALLEIRKLVADILLHNSWENIFEVIVLYK